MARQRLRGLREALICVRARSSICSTELSGDGQVPRHRCRSAVPMAYRLIDDLVLDSFTRVEDGSRLTAKAAAEPLKSPSRSSIEIHLDPRWSNTSVGRPPLALITLSVNTTRVTLLNHGGSQQPP